MDEYDDNDYSNLVYFKDAIDLEIRKLREKYVQIYYLIIDSFYDYDKHKQKLIEENWGKFKTQKKELEQKIVWLKELIKFKYRYCDDEKLKRFWGVVED